MGRYCGYIAVASSLASRDVNVCLIPEVHFQLEGELGVYEWIIDRARSKGHAVVVIAEGAEEALLPEERDKVREKLGIKEDIRDESGNIKSVVSIYIYMFLMTRLLILGDFTLIGCGSLYQVKFGFLC